MLHTIPIISKSPDSPESNSSIQETFINIKSLIEMYIKYFWQIMTIGSTILHVMIYAMN